MNPEIECVHCGWQGDLSELLCSEDDAKSVEEEEMTLQQALEIIQSELTDEEIRITADSVTIDVDGWEYELLEEGDADKQIASLRSSKS